MSDISSSAEQARHRELADEYRRGHPGATPGQSGWSVGIEFAGVMMLVLGSIHALQGLAALLNDDFYAVGSDGLLVDLGFTVWGWVHLGLGVLVATAGVAVNAGRPWARVVTVVFASLSLLTNLVFVNAQPVWSAIVVAIDVLVIHAVTAHGGELAR